MSRVVHSAASELKRCLRTDLMQLGTTASFDEIKSSPWASITFHGARHQLTVNLTGANAQAAADAFLDGLADRSFNMRGHVLADIECVEVRRDGDTVSLTLNALTVDDQ